MNDTATARRRPGRDLLTFDRTDRWGLLGLLAVLSLAAAWAWVVGPLVAWAQGDAIPVEMTSPVSVPALEAVGITPGSGTYQVLVEDPTVGQRLLSLAPGVAWVIIVGLTCWLVWRLMRTIAAGDPFDPANVTRLRGIGGLLVLGTAVAFAVELVARGVLTSSIDTGDPVVGVFLSVPWLPMVTGMVAALLAEAFKAGSRLRDDLDGLV